MMSGHFFCEHCEEVQFVRFTGRLLIKCPTCHLPQCRWIVDAVNDHPNFKRVKAISFERGRQLFQKLNQALKTL